MEIEVFRNWQNKYGMPDLNDLTLNTISEKKLEYVEKNLIWKMNVKFSDKGFLKNCF